jgi:hypothetical protein
MQSFSASWPAWPNGRVAEVVRQRDRLDQVLVQPQRPRDRTRELRHFERVREAGAKQVALMVEEHLGLVDQPAEGGGVDDAVAVALEVGARGRGGSGWRRPRDCAGIAYGASRRRAREPRGLCVHARAP